MKYSRNGKHKQPVAPIQSPVLWNSMHSTKEPHLYRVGTKCVLVFLFNHEKEVSLASVFSLILLTYEFNGQFFIISGACGVVLSIGKKNSSLYHFYEEWKMDWWNYLYITKILLLTILWFCKSNPIPFWSTCMWV